MSARIITKFKKNALKQREPKNSFTKINLHFGMFDMTAMVLIGPVEDLVEWATWWADGVAPDIPNHPKFNALFMVRDGHAPIIWLPKKPVTPYELGTFAHEAMHLVRYLFINWAGLPLTSESDEAYAHAMGFVVKSVLEITHTQTEAAKDKKHK